MDLTSLATDGIGNTYLSGTFTNSLPLLGTDYQSFGLADTYVMKLADGGEPLWVIAGGSEGNDTDSGVCTDAFGNLYWVGGFWLSASYQEQQYTSTKSSKSFFFTKYDEEGTVLWSKLIEGTGVKNSSPPTTDVANNVYLTGSFSDSLFIDDQILLAQATEDVFVGKWDQEGTLMWLTHFGISGLNRAREVTISPTGQVIIGGVFKGQMAIAEDTIATNTPDFDVFIASLTSEGTPAWIRKAGGVLEKNFSSITLDKESNIYVVGQYTGRLTLNEAIEITTDGFNENGYVLKFSNTGQPLWASSLGSITFDTSTDILYNEDLTVSGFFEKEFTSGELSSLGVGNLTGYLLNLDTAGNNNTLSNISSDNLLLINQLDQSSSQQLIVGGTFKGNLSITNDRIMSEDHFSVFIGQYADPTTRVNDYHPSITIYPNPSDQFLIIDVPFIDFQVRLWTKSGQLVFQGKNSNKLNTDHLRSGTYFLQLNHSSSVPIIKKVIIQH